MAVQSNIKKIVLKGIYRSALAGSVSLREALDAAFDVSYESIENGNFISGTTGSGYSVQFSLPSRSFSPLTIAQAVSELDDLYTCAAIHATEDTDASRVEWMLAKLRTPSKISHHFRNISI